MLMMVKILCFINFINNLFSFCSFGSMQFFRSYLSEYKTLKKKTDFPWNLLGNSISSQLLLLFCTILKKMYGFIFPFLPFYGNIN